MHEDAAIAAVGHGIAGYLQPAGLDRIDAGVRRARYVRTLDAAGSVLQRQPVLAAAGDLAIVDDQMGDAAEIEQALRIVAIQRLVPSNTSPVNSICSACSAMIRWPLPP